MKTQQQFKPWLMGSHHRPAGSCFSQRFEKGDSTSAPQNQTINANVASNQPGGAGGPAGSGTTSGATVQTGTNETAVQAGGINNSLTVNASGQGSGGNPVSGTGSPGTASQGGASTVVTQNFNDPAAALAAIAANVGVTETAIQNQTILSASAIGNANDLATKVLNTSLQQGNQNLSLINNLVNNFEGIVASFVSHTPAPTVAATAPTYNYYQPAGNSQTAQDVNAVNSNAAANPTPANTNSTAGASLTSGEMIAIGVAVVGLIAVVWFAHK